VTKHTLVRLAAIVPLLLLALSHLPASAQGGGIQYSSEDTRHFEGERFITLTNIRVHARPSADAEIVRDIPRMRMVYAKPGKDAGWLEVFGAGVQRHPYRRQGILDPVEVENGKLVLELKRVDRNVYRRFSGYVEASGLGSLDRPLLLPEDLKAQMVPIPGPLEKIGVSERRFVPRNPLASPFRSVVRVSFGGKYSCTGFVVEKSGLVATSGHCFDDGDTEQQITVMVPSPESGYRQAVSLPARVVYRRSDYWNSDQARSGGGDSALLEVTDGRILDVPPLALATPGAWLRTGSIEVMTLGFGGDLMLLKKEWTKSDSVPHADRCTLSAGQAFWSFTSQVLHVRPTNLDCAIGPGDSGGPLLFFNSTSSRFEVLAIATWGRRNELYRNAMSAEARALLETVRQEQERRHGYQITTESLQGMSTLRKLLDRSSSTYQSAEGWLIDERLYREVAIRTGRPSSFERLQDGLEAGPSSMIALVEKITYQVNNQSLLDDFRRARLALSTPVPTASAKQARETYGNRLLAQSLREQGVGFTQFRFGKVLDLGRLLIPQSDFADYTKTLQPEIDALLKEKPHLKVSVQRAIQDSEQLLIEAGRDLYVLDPNLEITEVIRNWMRDFKGSRGSTK